MVVAINYADKSFRKTQKFNSKRALKYGADQVISYTEKSLPEKFVRENSDIMNYKRGGGYWLWKFWIILDALDKIGSGDYLVYTDSGSAFVEPVSLLINAMEREATEVMCFCCDQEEIKWSKRDALILMDCDKEEYLHSAQICGGYIILKKSERTIALMQECLAYATDRRIITDEENVMGVPNYPEFVENRHDQTIWSLVCKKHRIAPFRDPSEWGNDYSRYPEDVIKRSTYPQVIESHRHRTLRYSFELKYKEKKWYWLPRKFVHLIDLIGEKCNENK